MYKITDRMKVNKLFHPVGEKFTFQKWKWIAGKIKFRDPSTAMEIQFQHWRCEKTWLIMTCEFSFRRQEAQWKIERYSTSRTQKGAAQMAITETDEAIKDLLFRLAKFGDQHDKTYALKALQRRKIEFEGGSNETAF